MTATDDSTANGAEDTIVAFAPPASTTEAPSRPSAPPSPLPDANLSYTLTTDQARERFLNAHRHVPSQRSMQRYAVDGDIAAIKIKHTRNGMTLAEWLYNDASVDAFITRQPIIEVTESAASKPPSAAPTTMVDVIAPAVTPSRIPQEPASHPAAQDFDSAGEPVGERRTLASVLIDNARLTADVAELKATVEGRDRQIADLQDDKQFLREEVRENRTLRDYMRSISSEMLSTFKAIAIESARSRSAEPPPSPRDARPIDTP